MRDGYHIGTYRGQFCAKLFVNGQRHGRFTLGTDNRDAAERQIRELNTQRERDQLPASLTVDAIMELYVADRQAEGKAAVYRMKQCRELLKPHFGALLSMQIDKQRCKAYIDHRRGINVSDATIRTELSYLSAALNFAVDMQLIPARPRIWRTPQGRPRSAIEDYHLTRPEADQLLKAAEQTPHLRLWIILALATAGRPLHILQLTWGRVDFHRRSINLDDPDRDRTAKGRARVAMNDMAREALQEARRHATGAFVIEFEGKPIRSIKGALKRAAARARVEASPYVLRHTAAVWMAEDGVSMEEIAQIMGHTNIETTRNVYARFSPSHQRKAVSSLQVVRVSDGSLEPATRDISGTAVSIGRPT